MSASQRHERLRQRAEMLARLRAFFANRGFLEVETPLLDREIIPELHIEPFGVLAEDSKPRLWLQASPELHMKRLLAEGLPAIYQVTRSFRRGERGRLHNPEFTIVEWYRAGDDYAAGICLLADLIEELAVSAPRPIITTYAKAFQKCGVINAYAATPDELATLAAKFGVNGPEGMARESRDEWLNLLLATTLEQGLGAAGPEIVIDYPKTQAALASTVMREIPDDPELFEITRSYEVAERFELYWKGVELANGYHELTDAAVLRRRLDAVNEQRVADGRPALPLPERLLAAMETPGLPACSGCALGFDRLVMLACGAQSVDEVIAFPWET
jgi:elongation factor P--(R)-beta-lysine ligase